MELSKDIENLCAEIFESKKYATLYKPLVLRICEEEYKKYANKKERIKGVKNTLHAMFGAYFTPDCYKKANKLIEKMNSEGENKDEILEHLLRLHVSTKERMAYLEKFYHFIFENTGQVKSILDMGCGLNPLTLSYMPNNSEIVEYHAFDIDTRIAELNNRYFAFLGLPALAGCADIAAETPQVAADVAFLFKLLPLIERQAKGRVVQLLKEIDAKHIVVTYPTKSLSGKNKGMRTFYASAFEEMFESLAGEGLEISAKGEVGDELIYVVRRS
ncbi:MAG: Rmt family 16S rRNA (guanine(1405)-N(7))-methyltransferase [Defluviitaleaceae bacterium]|nr:Rmt family 16S rRNA (guanine(1405)-N(7))-methyltransferase [Defluviitaleaceae bacterium]